MTWIVILPLGTKTELLKPSPYGRATAPTGSLIAHYSLLITHHYDYHAQAYASVRGSVPALITPVFGSMTMAASEPLDQGPVTCNL